MSQNNRLPYDACALAQSQFISAGAGKYQLETPSSCDGCFPMDALRVQRLGGASCLNHSLIEIDSELKLINERATKCNHVSSVTCDTKLLGSCEFPPVENTRLNNPPSTMRCQGINRFDTLLHNPQHNSFRTLDYVTYNVPSRIVMKDNYRPICETPLNQFQILPHLNASDETFDGIKSSGVSTRCCQQNSGVNTNPSITWNKF